MTEARAISDGRLTDAELSEAIKRSAGRTDKMTIDAEKAHGLFSELLALREAVKPFVHFYEQANRVKGDLHQSFCDIDTGTSAALKPTHFAKLAALTALQDTTHAK